MSQSSTLFCKFLPGAEIVRRGCWRLESHHLRKLMRRRAWGSKIRVAVLSREIDILLTEQSQPTCGNNVRKFHYDTTLKPWLRVMANGKRKLSHDVSCPARCFGKKDQRIAGPPHINPMCRATTIDRWALRKVLKGAAFSGLIAFASLAHFGKRIRTSWRCQLS